jgi:hypothetical protein
VKASPKPGIGMVHGWHGWAIPYPVMGSSLHNIPHSSIVLPVFEKNFFREFSEYISKEKGILSDRSL